MSEDTRKEDSLHAVSYQEPLPSSPGPPLAAVRGSSLEEIFQEHNAQVLRAAYRVTGNASDAEDVLQTVFLRLIRRSEPPGPSRELAPYLHRAAVNAALDTLRSRKRARAVPLEEDGPDAREDPRPGPDRHQRGRELRTELRSAIAGLSPRAAEIFVLRFIEGYGNKEIAQMLGTSQTAVGVTLHRTRAQLREELAGFAGDPS